MPNSDFFVVLTVGIFVFLCLISGERGLKLLFWSIATFLTSVCAYVFGALSWGLI